MLYHNLTFCNITKIYFILVWNLHNIREALSFQHGIIVPLQLKSSMRPQYILRSTKDINPDRGYNGYFKSPIIRFSSSPFWMDDVLEENEDNTDISYLKFVDFHSLPPGSESILKKVTKTYVESDVKRGENNLKVSEVLDTIEKEYKYTPVPYKVGNNTISFESLRNKGKADSQSVARTIVCKVLSFAALHRLPETLVIYLFGNLMNEKEINTEAKKEIMNLLDDFQKFGWASVEFIQGISVRIKRDYILNRRKRFYPLPRKSIFTRSQDTLAATKALEEAKLVHPPLKLVRKQVIMEEINELNIQSELSERSSLKDMMLTFFPNKDKQLTRFVRVTAKQTLKVRSLVRAGFISYCLLSFIWYTFSIFWQWFTYPLPESQGIFLVHGKIRRSMQKFVKLFVSTYFNPRLTKFYRFTISLLLIPLGNRALEWTQHKFKVNADSAVGLISASVVILSMGLWALIILGDVTFCK